MYVSICLWRTIYACTYIGNDFYNPPLNDTMPVINEEEDDDTTIIIIVVVVVVVCGGGAGGGTAVGIRIYRKRQKGRCSYIHIHS